MKLKHISLYLVLVMLWLPLGRVWASAANGGSASKETVTISYNDSILIRDFLLSVKDKYPQYNIQLTNNSYLTAKTDMTGALIDYLVSHDAQSDLVVDSAINQDTPNLTQSFADLSGKPYTANYQTSYLNDANKDGHLYYLPFTLKEQGIIVNKTLFQEKGWAIPQNYSEFESLIDTILADPSGITPLYKESMVMTVDSWLKLGYAMNEGSSLQGYGELTAFNQGSQQASSIAMENTFRYFNLLVKAGTITEKNLVESVSNTSIDGEGYYELINRKSAMVFTSGQTLQTLKLRDAKDEYVLLPLYSPSHPQGYVAEENSANIAISRDAMADPQKSAIIDEIMTYIASEEGQKDLLESTMGIKSPCYGVMETGEKDSTNELLITTLKKGYLVTPIPFEKIDNTYYDVFKNYLFHNADGQISTRSVQQAIDNARKSYLANEGKNDVSVAEVKEDFTKDETKYLFLKAMARGTKADFAILPNTEQTNYYGLPKNSEAVLTNLYKGSLTKRDIMAIVFQDNTLSVYSVTGKQLMEMMDYNASTFMLYGAQMVYTYDKEKDIYKTVDAILPDGTSIDPSKTYTLATSPHSNLEESYKLKGKEAGLDISSALIQYCGENSNLSPESTPQVKIKK